MNNSLKDSQLLIERLSQQQTRLKSRADSIQATLDKFIIEISNLEISSREVHLDIDNLANEKFVQHRLEYPAFNDQKSPEQIPLIPSSSEGPPTEFDILRDSMATFRSVYANTGAEFGQMVVHAQSDPLAFGLVEKEYTTNLPIYGSLEYTNTLIDDILATIIFNNDEDEDLEEVEVKKEEVHVDEDETNLVFTNESPDPFESFKSEEESFTEIRRDSFDGQKKSRGNTMETQKSANSQRHRPYGGVHVFSEQVEDQLRERSLSTTSQTLTAASVITSPSNAVAEAVPEVKPVVSVVPDKSTPVQNISTKVTPPKKVSTTDQSLGSYEVSHVQTGVPSRSRPAPARRRKNLKPAQSTETLFEQPKKVSIEPVEEIVPVKDPKPMRKSLFADEPSPPVQRKTVLKSLFDDDEDETPKTPTKQTTQSPSKPNTRKSLFGEDQEESKSRSTRQDILKSLFEDD